VDQRAADARHALVPHRLPAGAAVQPVGEADAGRARAAQLAVDQRGDLDFRHPRRARLAGGRVQQRHHRADAHVDRDPLAAVFPAHDHRSAVAPHRQEHALVQAFGQLGQHGAAFAHEIDVGQGRQAHLQRLRAEAVARGGRVLLDKAHALERHQVAVHLGPGHAQQAAEFGDGVRAAGAGHGREH